jgi:trimeric autotransporter adhesin
MTIMPASVWFLFAVGTILAQAQQYVISTYAGGGPLPAQVPGNNLSIDWNSKGLAVGTNGNVYFTSLNCVFRWDRDGTVTRIAGNSRHGYSGDGGPATSAQFSMEQIVSSPPYLGSLPPGLAVDNAGNVYVADNGNSRIRKISPDGIVTTVAGNGTFGFSGDGGPAVNAQLSSVLGLAVDAAGNLLLADSDSHRVRRVAPDGTITSVAGNGVCGFSGDGGAAAGAQLCNPAGVAMDHDGNLFIAEIGNNRIRRISPGGIIATAIGTGISEPTNVSVDGAGNLFVVSDSGDFWESWQAVRKFSTSGTMTVVAGDVCAPRTAYCPPPPSDGTTAVTTHLGDRLSTALDGAGNLLVAAPYIRRIYRVSPDGSIATAAGNGEYDFSGDGGPARSARLANPGSLAVDGTGSVSFVDYFNSRVRKVFPDGTITTVAGNGDYGSAGDGGLATNASLSPTAIASDGMGNLFISNNFGGVRKVSPDGIVNTVAGRGVTLALDLAGNLFIGDYTSLHKVAPDGSTTVVAGRAYALSLAVDNAGNLFFAAATRVGRLSPDGSIVTVAGNGTQGFSGDGGPATEAQLNYAVGVAVDGGGNLFVADRDNNRIRKVSPDGIITTIAGNGTRGYSGDDGRATDAAMSSPGSVAVDAVGNVYFSDVYNNVVRVLRPNQ